MNKAFYGEIKKILSDARNKVYQTANFAMVEAYWQIGKSIVEEQNGEERAEYGTGLLKELSNQMTRDFGKGFTVANLKNMRQFYLTFPNSYALRSELSWTHYRLLMRVENVAQEIQTLEQGKHRRILFVIHMCWNSLDCLRMMIFMKVTWNRLLLHIYKSFYWN